MGKPNGQAGGDGDGRWLALTAAHRKVGKMTKDIAAELGKKR